MRIRNPWAMLCLCAASALIISSCQKEQLLPERPSITPASEEGSVNENDVCGSVLPTDPVQIQQMLSIEKLLQDYIRNHPQETGNGARTIITIPVVFHVVYSTAEQNISDAQLQSQIDVLNEDFSATNTDLSNVPSVFQSIVGNAGLHFVLAARDPQGNATTGITRTQTTVTSFSSNGSVCFASLGGHDAWPASQYLNIWVCNKSGAAGYSAYPWSGNPSTDGILVKYTYVGRVGTFTNNWNYQRGRTITHEVGHWLGLIHIWGDASCGSDLVDDTPTQSAANGSCPSFPDLSTCSPTASGDMFMNYMDYTYDACRAMFSQMQVTRMLGYLNTVRVSILTSQGAIPPPSATCNVPGGLGATAITSSGATLNWTNTGAISYNVRYKPALSSIWINLITSSTSIPVAGLMAATTYEFQVQSTCSSGSSAYSSSATFTTQSLVALCAVPGGLGTSSISGTNATLIWNSTGAQSYNVRYRKTSSTTWTTVSAYTTYRTISWLTPNSTYEFQVRSVCASGASAYSASSLFTTGN